MVAADRCLAALLVIAAACARPLPAPVTSSRVPPDPYVISSDELQDPVILGMDTERAIRYLRPIFYRTSGPQSFVDGSAGLVQYSVDFGPLQPVGRRAPFGALSLLSLFENRYLNANEAQNRFGINANGGPVIVLLTHEQ